MAELSGGTFQQQITPESAPDLPATSADVLKLFTDCIRADGAINGRSTLGRALRQVKDSLKADSNATLEAVLHEDIAQSMVMERVISALVISDPASIVKEGQINPMLSGALLKFRDSKHRAINMLLSLERNRRSKPGSLGDLTLE